MVTEPQEEKACRLLHNVLCQIRLLAGCHKGDKELGKIWDLADAAHNLPLALCDSNYDLECLLNEGEDMLTASGGSRQAGGATA